MFAELASRTLWRLAARLTPIIGDALNGIAWCHPRYGVIGAHSWQDNGRCAVCHQTRPPRPHLSAVASNTTGQLLTGVLTTHAYIGRPPHGDYEYTLRTIGGQR